MIPTIRAELRKLLTVRSTYVISGLTLGLIGFFTFYSAFDTARKVARGLEGAMFDPGVLQRAMTDAVMVASIFIGIAAILFICYEYRYNTIAYSLTISNSRVKVLLAKLKVISVYAVVLTFLAMIMAIAMTYLGAAIGGGSLGSQHVEWWSLLWRSLVFAAGSAWLGLILGFLTRSLVAAIVLYFVIPTIEPLLHNLLKINQNYLLSASQNNIMQTSTGPDAFTAAQSAGVFIIYLAVGLIVASILFERRDAMN